MKTGSVHWILAAIAMVVLAVPATAQQAWVQIEARATLGQAEERARAWSGTLDNVTGYRLASGWYAIVLGPFGADEAEVERVRLLQRGAIPRDSFIADGGNFANRFWPDGNPIAVLPLPDDSTGALAAVPAPAIQAPDETLAEARAGERALSPEARRELQAALEWEGYYTGALDGLIGPGTRRSMAAWQADQNFEPTGVLTTAQRATLTQGFFEARDSLGLTLVDEIQTGVAIDVPGALVAFDRYEAPFAHFEATGEDDVQLLLISQEGDRDRMAALYEVLQTLSIVPVEGARALNRRSFRIEGRDARRVTSAYAEVADGSIKGYVLVWPSGDDRRRGLAVDALRTSFRATPGVLSDTAGVSSEQRPDLVAGLQIRRPIRAQSGFYVDGTGKVATAASDLGGCGRVTLGDDVDVDVLATDATLGVALLQPGTAIAPIGVAEIATSPAKIRSEVAVSGFSFGGVLSAPSLTYGTLDDLRDLDGNTRRDRLTLAAEDGDAGGPVLTPDGAVAGLLLPADTGTRTLPKDVALTADGTALAGFLAENGVIVSAADPQAAMAPEDLAIRAADMTVLVNCWE